MRACSRLARLHDTLQPDLCPQACRASSAGPPFRKVLIANRGEISVRIARAAQELGVATVAVFTSEDEQSLHTVTADEARLLPADPSGDAVKPYLDIESIIAIALAAGADCIHPGYGFLSENAEFAARCRQAGLVFVGPAAETIELFGSKTAARAFAARCGIPVLRGSAEPLDGAVEGAAAAAVGRLGLHYPVMLKAVAGGGGRGMRVVRTAAALPAALASAVRESRAAFGASRSSVFVEEFVDRARHIEVQILGDGSGEVVHLGERDCSVQVRLRLC